MYRTLLITVEHQSPDLTARLFSSVRRAYTQSDLFLLTVQNGPDSLVTDAPCSSQKSDENSWVLGLGPNRGYLGSAKQGLAWFKEKQPDSPDWIIVCNNDIRIEQPDFFEHLNQLDPRSAGVLAPRIISCKTGLDQNPFMERRLGRLRVAELRFWLRSYYSALLHEQMSTWKHRIMSLTRVSARRKERTDQPRQIYAPHGSFMIFSRQFFACGGFLDGGFFLFHEEISIAEIARKVGFPILYYPKLSVLHDEHSSTGARFTRAKYECQKRSFRHLTTDYLADLQ